MQSIIELTQACLSFRSEMCRYVKTTDGTKKVFQPGEVMFQDNVESSPAAKQPQHESGIPVNDRQPWQKCTFSIRRGEVLKSLSDFGLQAQQDLNHAVKWSFRW